MKHLAKTLYLALPVLLWAGFSQCSDSYEPEELRAYTGAPPTIPHEVKERGRKDCLSCHRFGDAVNHESRLSATKTPHAKFVNCIQCHVERNEDDLFAENDFQDSLGVKILSQEVKANPIGPPYIPHNIQNRGNCGGCHLQKDRPELYPGHAHRTNCTQCHVVQDSSAGDWLSK